MKASTTICRLVLSFLSQFFRRRHFSSQAKDRSGVTPVHQHVLHLTEAVSAPVKHRQSPGPVGNVGGSHVRMGQSLRSTAI